MAFTPSYSAVHNFGSGEYVYGVGAVPGRVIVLTYSKFSYSTDAGATWTAGATLPGTGTTDDYLRVVDGAVYARRGTAVVKTTDGATFTTLTDVTQIYGGGGGVLFGMHLGAVKRSLDGGATWGAITIPGGLDNYLSGMPIVGDGTTFVGLSSGGGVYRSTDSGATFTLVTANDYEDHYGLYWSGARSQFIRVRWASVLVSPAGLDGTWTALSGYLGESLFVPGENFDLLVRGGNSRIHVLPPSGVTATQLPEVLAGNFGAYAGGGRFVLGYLYQPDLDATPDGVATVTITSDVPLASSNDNFANAISLVGASGSVTANTAGDTVQAGEPAGAANTIWYSITPATNKRLSIDLTGSFGGAVAQVFSGAAVDALSEVFPGLGQFPLTGGTTYRVRVGGSSGGGDVAMAWALTDPPATSANDDFEDAIALVGSTGSVSGNTTTDTLQAGEPAGLETSVWYSHAPGAKYVRLDLFDASYESSAYPFLGTAVGALTEMSAATSTSDLHRYTTVKVQDAQTYMIQVGLDAGTTAPTSTGFTLAWEASDHLPPPVSAGRYLILEDSLVGAAALDTQLPDAMWPPFGVWGASAGLSKTAEGLAFDGELSQVAFIDIAQESLDTFAVDARVMLKFSKAVGSSTYGTLELSMLGNGSVRVSLSDYGLGPRYLVSVYLDGGNTEHIAEMPYVPTYGEFVEIRLRVGRGRIELVSGYATLISVAWDGLAGSPASVATTEAVRLSGGDLNVLKDLSVVLSSVDLPPVEPPAPPDGPFWGGFINSAETLQVL